MNIVIATLLRVLTATPEEGAALAETAPAYLDAETGARHLTAARVAAVVNGVKPSLVLSIAYYESRYHADAVTKEPRGKWSCGVLTPIPRKGGCVPKGLAAGYMEGAEHLRDWLDACASKRVRRQGLAEGGRLLCSLRGYAGGYSLLRACARGPVMRDRGKHGRVDLCRFVVDRRVARAARIRASLTATRRVPRT